METLRGSPSTEFFMPSKTAMCACWFAALQLFVVAGCSEPTSIGKATAPAAALPPAAPAAALPPLERMLMAGKWTPTGAYEGSQYQRYTPDGKTVIESKNGDIRQRNWESTGNRNESKRKLEIKEWDVSDGPSPGKWHIEEWQFDEAGRNALVISFFYRNSKLEKSSRSELKRAD